MSEQGPTNWYIPGESIAEFHGSRVETRVLLGGRGSGKTTAIAVETVGHAFHTAGAKIYILRKTQDSNEDTTLETFEIVFANCGSAYVDTGESLFKKVDGGRSFRLPSRKAAELFNEFKKTNPNKAATKKWLDTVGDRYCSWLNFAGVPSGQYRATRFRGYECSMLIFVEADQLQKEDLDLGVACLRWKGADPETCDERGFIIDTCCILDSNPPSPRHWIAQMEDEAKSSGDATIKFWHIATVENKHNLPPGYVEKLIRQYAKNPAMHARMVLGEYADAFDGSPVLYAFSQEHAYPNLDWPKGAYLVRGWDFGSTHTCIWSAYWESEGCEYWWDLFEYYARQSDVDRQCRRVLETTSKVFPFFNDRSICAGVKDYCDVAGRQKKDTGSSIATLHSYDIYPGHAKMFLQDSLSICNRLLEKKDKKGNLVYRIDKNSCPMLYTASIGGYRYPNLGEPGFGGSEPLKDGEYDHLADAARYAKVNCLRLLKMEHEKASAAVGPLAHKARLNRPKRWY